MPRLMLVLVLVTACSKLIDLTDVTYDGRAPDSAIPDVAPPPMPDAATPGFDCPTYCTTIAANCPGTRGYAQYGGVSPGDATLHCVATCANFRPGTPADLMGNTLGCHLFHANAAKSDPGNECSNAGPAGALIFFPLGAGVCGDPCQNYCTLELAACGVLGSSPTAQYLDLPTCVNACLGFDRTHAYRIDASVFPTIGPMGNSLACRLYHTLNALLVPGMYCPFTGVPNVGPCSGPPVP